MVVYGPKYPLLWVHVPYAIRIYTVRTKSVPGSRFAGCGCLLFKRDMLRSKACAELRYLTDALENEKIIPKRNTRVTQIPTAFGWGIPREFVPLSSYLAPCFCSGGHVLGYELEGIVWTLPCLPTPSIVLSLAYNYTLGWLEGHLVHLFFLGGWYSLSPIHNSVEQSSPYLRFGTTGSL